MASPNQAGQEDNGRMHLERAAYLANIISAFTGLYCAYASWKLLHPQEQQDGTMLSHTALITIFIVSLAAVACSAVFTLIAFAKSRAGEKLVEAKQTITDRSSELNAALFEIGQLKEAVQKSKTASASVGDININLNQANQQAQQQQVTAHTPTLKEPKPNHNIVALQPRISFITGTHHDTFVETNSPAVYGQGAALAVYENAPRSDNTHLGSEYDVIAHITYSDEQGNEIHRIQSACWLNASGAVHFLPLTKHELLIASQLRSGFQLWNEPFPIKLTHEKFSVHVRLLTKKGIFVRLDHYLLVASEKEFSITLEPQKI